MQASVGVESSGGGPSPSAEQRAHIDDLTQQAWKVRSTDVVRANEIARQAHELSIECGYKLGQARSARTLSMTAVDIEGLRGTLALAEEARNLFDEVGDQAGRAGARDFLSLLAEFLGDHATGMQLALEALEIARSIGHAKRQGYALSSVGGLLAATGEVDAAIERFREGLSLFEELGNMEGVARLCSRLANVLASAERYEEALVYAEQCRAAAERTTSSFAKGGAVVALADLHVRMGNADLAEPLYRSAIQGFENRVRQSLGSSVYIKLGKILMDRGELGEAGELLTTALENLRSVDMGIADEVDANETLADLREREGDLAAAMSHLREAMRLRDRWAQREAKNKVMQVQIRAEIDAARKDAEIHKLRFVELHAMQAQLVEAEKSALLGTLAAGAAHELNTPLGVLSSNLGASASAAKQLSAASGVPGELSTRARRLLDVIESSRKSSEEALERIGSLTERFMQFSRLDRAEHGDFDVREGLDAALSLLEPTVREGVTLERELGEVPRIVGWPRELNHAFMTVLSNAVDAIDGHGVVRAVVTQEGSDVVVRIADTGHGMTAEQCERLFDVGWSDQSGRTKMKLGLSAALSTVKRHGGKLEVESRVGQGTTFTFRLPAAAR